jgi:hypothetical protein
VAAGELTIVPGDLIEIDFAAGTISLRGGVYRFPPLGSVPQSLVVAGGIENLVKQKLGK